MARILRISRLLIAECPSENPTPDRAIQSFIASASRLRLARSHPARSATPFASIKRGHPFAPSSESRRGCVLGPISRDSLGQNRKPNPPKISPQNRTRAESLERTNRSARRSGSVDRDGADYLMPGVVEWNGRCAGGKRNTRPKQPKVNFRCPDSPIAVSDVVSGQGASNDLVLG